MLDHGEPDYPMTTQEPEAASTEEELDAANILLSLGENCDETLDEDTENANLMPIGGQNIPIDAAPEPIRLDQVSVDDAIASLIETDELSKDVSSATDTKKTADDYGRKDTEHLTVPAMNNEPTVKGSLKTKTYALKKKTDSKRHSFKCSECKVVKKTIKDLNIHHEESHNPQLCGICGH